MSPELLEAWLRDVCPPEQESQHGCYLKGFRDGEESSRQRVDRLQRENDLLADKLSSMKAAASALLAVPEVRKAAANWATDELIAVRELI